MYWELQDRLRHYGGDIPHPVFPSSPPRILLFLDGVPFFAPFTPATKLVNVRASLPTFKATASGRITHDGVRISHILHRQSVVFPRSSVLGAQPVKGKAKKGSQFIVLLKKQKSE